MGKKPFFLWWHSFYYFNISVIYIVNADVKNPISNTVYENENRHLVKLCCSKDKFFDTSTRKCIGADLSTHSKLDVLEQRFRDDSDDNITLKFKPVRHDWTQEKYEVINVSFNDPLKSTESKVEIATFYNEYFQFVHLYDKTDYCINIAFNSKASENETKSKDDIVFLQPRPYRTAHIRLCCHVGYIFDINSRTCQNISNNDRVDLVKVLDDVDRFDDYDIISTEDVTTFLFGIPKCDSFHVEQSSREPFNLYNTGNLKIEKSIFAHNYYCLSDIKPISLKYSEAASAFDAMIVRCEYPWRKKVIDLQLAPTLLITSDIFLLALCARVISKSAHKLFGAMELSVIINLFIYNITVTIAKLWQPSSYNQYPNSCFIVGIAIQFSYLSVMFWLNAMSFDVWSTFRHMKATRMVGRASSLKRGKLDGFKVPKYIWYSFYGWGIPAFVMIVTLVMQFLPKHLTQGYTTPGIGEENCFLRSHWASFYYKYLVAGVGLIFNLVLFASFTWNMWCGLWSTRELDKMQGATQSRAKSNLKMTLKIFFLLGLTWLLDIIAFVLEPYEQSYISVEILVVVFLIINASHGIIFFLVVFFDKSTVKQIEIWCGRSNFGRRVSQYYSTVRSTTTSSASSRRTRSTSLGMIFAKSEKSSTRLRSTKNQPTTPETAL